MTFNYDTKRLNTKKKLNTRRHFKVKTNKYKNKYEVLIKYKI